MPRGLYVLIAKKDGRRSRSKALANYAKVLTKARNQEIRSAFIEEFKKRDFNAGLEQRSRRDRNVCSPTAKAESGGVIRAAVAPPCAAVPHRGPGPASLRHREPLGEGADSASGRCSASGW